MESNYVVFSRAARNWEEFSSANKRIIRKGLTREQARSICSKFNDNRTDLQRKSGVAYEFCQAGNI
jgi:hypothetical protein